MGFDVNDWISNQVAGDLGVEVGEQVLMGVFSPAVEMSSEPQGRSAICIYSLQYIDTLFDQVWTAMTQCNNINGDKTSKKYL